MAEPKKVVRVLRIMEYLYTDSHAALADRMNWSTPANGIKKWNDRETIRSSTMDEEYVDLDTAGILAQQELQGVLEALVDYGVEPRTVLSGVRDLINQARAWKGMYEEAKQGITGTAPEYVYKLIDALFSREPLDFEECIVPPEVQGYLVGKGIKFKYKGAQ